MSIPIVPVPLPSTPPIITSFNYNVNNLVLSSNITFNVILLDANNTPVSVQQVTIAGEDYTNWGNNDQYVINYICNALGLTQLDPPPPEPIIDVPQEIVITDPTPTDVITDPTPTE